MSSASVRLTVDDALDVVALVDRLTEPHGDNFDAHGWVRLSREERDKYWGTVWSYAVVAEAQRRLLKLAGVDEPKLGDGRGLLAAIVHQFTSTLPSHRSLLWAVKAKYCGTGAGAGGFTAEPDIRSFVAPRHFQALFRDVRVELAENTRSDAAWPGDGDQGCLAREVRVLRRIARQLEDLMAADYVAPQ